MENELDALEELDIDGGNQLAQVIQSRPGDNFTGYQYDSRDNQPGSDVQIGAEPNDDADQKPRARKKKKKKKKPTEMPDDA